MRYIFIAISILGLAACTGSDANAQEDAASFISERYSVADFEAKMNELDNEILLDVRTDKEIEMYGMISGAVNFDIYEDDFLENIATLDNTKPIMVYCWSGGRSAEAAAILKDNGFTEIYDLADGFDAWSQENEQ